MRRLILFLILVAGAGRALAGNDINDIGALDQGQFHALSKDLGAIVTSKQLQSAAPQGVVGFDLGFDLGTTNVANASAWQAATSGQDVNSVTLAELRASKGLPLGFDIGGFYAYAQNSNIRAYGAELRYAILDGSAFTPAVGLRAAFSNLAGVSGLGLRTRSLDLTISQAFGPFVPYAGIGRVWIASTPGAGSSLRNESIAVDESFAGLAVQVLVVNFALQADRTAGNNTYSVKLGFGF